MVNPQKNYERGGLLNFSERRAATRFRGRLPVELAQGRGVTRDFSALGVFFETDLPLSVGEDIEFVIPMEHLDWGPSFRVRWTGTIIRIEPWGERRGVAVAIDSYRFEGVH